MQQRQNRHFQAPWLSSPSDNSFAHPTCVWAHRRPQARCWFQVYHHLQLAPRAAPILRCAHLPTKEITARVISRQRLLLGWIAPVP